MCYAFSSVFITEYNLSPDSLDEEHERCKYCTTDWNIEFTSGFSIIRVSQYFVPRVLFRDPFVNTMRFSAHVFYIYLIQHVMYSLTTYQTFDYISQSNIRQ